MDFLEVSAKTVEEATKKALSQLGVGLEDVEITVLGEGKGGILGLGAEDARISVKLKANPAQRDEAIDISREILENLLALMGIKAAVNVDYSSGLPDENGAVIPTMFNITGDDLGILIGRRGQTLDALQYIVRLLTTRKVKSRETIILDVERYKKRRYEDLRTLALNVAEQVKLTKSSFRLEPMPAFERRIIHMTLADDPDVTTESTGEGESRKVIVIPRKKKQNKRLQPEPHMLT